MVLPPKPPKRPLHQENSIESNAPKIEKVQPDKSPKKNKNENHKKEKSSLLPMFRATLRGRDKKLAETIVKEYSSSTDSISSIGSDHQSLKTISNSPSGHAAVPNIPSSKISLEELQGGMKVMNTKKNLREERSVDGKTNNEKKAPSGHPNKPLPPPKPNSPLSNRHSFDIPSGGILSSTKTISTPKLTPIPIARSAIQTKSNNEESDMQKPSVSVKPVLKPRPTVVPRVPNQVSIPLKTETYALSISKDNLKSELIGVFDTMQLVYHSVKSLIALADARQSENIAEKATNIFQQCNELVDKLSTYRDSIAPVPRLNVSKHLTSIESNVNEFQKLSINLPRIATATDLEKLSKSLCALCNSLIVLSNALPSL